jgi:hypothetical protein
MKKIYAERPLTRDMRTSECIYDTDFRNGFCFATIHKSAYNELNKGGRDGTPFINNLSGLKHNAEVKGYSIKVDIKPRGSYTSLIKNFTDSTT